MAQMRKLDNNGNPFDDQSQGSGIPTGNLAPQLGGGGMDEMMGGGERAGGEGRFGEGPRERPRPVPGGALPGPGPMTPQPYGANAAPEMPHSPTPQAGSTFTSGGTDGGGIIPFPPMGSADVGSMATPKLRGLFGSAGGLQGGGLGVPLDPISNQQSDPISSLIESLMQQMGQGKARGKVGF